MSGRRGQLTREQQLEVGAVVIALRGARVPWKLLEGMFHVERTQLWRYARRYYASQMQQQTPQMQQQPSSAATVAA